MTTRPRLAVALTLLAMASGLALADEPPGPSDPYRQAILVGVWDYERENFKLGDMTADLEALRRTFKDVLQFNDIEVIANPDRPTLVTALNAAKARSALESDSRATLTVVYFAGHGTMIGHRSMLLTREFTTPSDVSEIGGQGSGGIGVDSIGDVLGGQAMLLLVEACRNPFKPAPAAIASPTDDLTSPVIVDESTPTVMLDAPPEDSRHSVLFAQAPGGVVIVRQRAPGETTPFVEAITSTLDQGLFNTLSGMYTEVHDRVRTRTGNQLTPRLVSEGQGEIVLRYGDVERIADAGNWQRFLALNRADVTRAFLKGFRTSLYTPVARWWLARQEALSNAQPMVAYTPEVRSDVLGRQRGFLQRKTPRETNPDSMLESVAGQRYEARAIASVRRAQGSVSDHAFIGETTGGETFRIERQLPRSFDPSLVNVFWTDAAVQSVPCEVDTILAAGCAPIERAIGLLQTRGAAEVGTVFVAAVFGGGAPGTVNTTSDRLLAVATRMRAAGIPDADIAVRTFYRSDLPQSPGDLLIKRGDGLPLTQE